MEDAILEGLHLAQEYQQVERKTRLLRQSLLLCKHSEQIDFIHYQEAYGDPHPHW